ncbi:hypothetical protein MNBD_GAMMA12-3803 [hydrothermal vent metagenome]|uniref:Uncharacterized protein n=1 Tax=hydrothermal vent metagenome TaxID=652676 RepID=A0A3B0Y7H4_9ZZZZ
MHHLRSEISINLMSLIASRISNVFLGCSIWNIFHTKLILENYQHDNSSDRKPLPQIHHHQVLWLVKTNIIFRDRNE